MNIKKFNFKEKWAIIDRLFKNMDNDHISEYSAQCSYYTILSFIPFIILLITMIQYTSIEQQALLEAISKIIPVSMNERESGVSSIRAWKNVYYMLNVCLSIIMVGIRRNK